MLAERCADRVKALILEDSPLTLDNYRRIIELGRDMFGAWLALKKRARSQHELALLLAQEYRSYPGLTSSWLLYIARCLWQLDPTFFSAMLSDFDDFAAGYNGQKILQNISCPVLCLRGEPGLGAVMTDQEISWMQKASNNVRYVQIDGVGHLLHLESQGQAPVLTAMMRFLAEPDAPPNGALRGSQINRE
jgi:pimeloyl-ACP methyl ester carboxylesterase